MLKYTDRKIVIFQHVASLPDAEKVFEEQIQTLLGSDILTHGILITCINGDSKPFINVAKKIGPLNGIIHLVCNSVEYWEHYTLDFLREKIQEDKDEYNILYIHLKGSSKIDNLAYRDWRKLMEYFNITRWRECVSKLDEGYDTVGVNWIPDFNRQGNTYYPHVKKHFSGNFWWAKSEYIKKLKPLVPPEKQSEVGKSPITDLLYIDDNFRYDHEEWIGTENPKYFEMHNSGVGHHTTLYPRHLYAK